MRRLLLVMLILAACAPPPSRPGRAPPSSNGSTRVHVVRQGETLWSISQRYGTTVHTLAFVNRVRDHTQLRVGQRLIVPNRRGALRPTNGNPWGRSDPRARSGELALAWPVRGRVTSAFGMRNGAHHEGLDISARQGTKIRAAAAGRVIHNDDDLAGYGNLIILKHKGSLSSVYAHNRYNLVRVGQFVEKGQVIAEVGYTGRASNPHLHFELRRNGTAVNPLDYLP